MSIQPVRVGFVGAGFFGQVAHLRQFSQLKSCQVVAVAEMRADLRQKVADKFGIPQTYATHREMLDQADIEAVVVVTARPAMGPIVLDCLNAGKHVLSEKPLANTAECASRLTQAARQKGVLHAVGYMKRHDAGVQAGCQLLQQLRTTQELGAVTYVRVQCFAGDAYCGEKDYVQSAQPRPPGMEQWSVAPAWISPELQTQYDRYVNTYCHDINLLRMLCGGPLLQAAFLNGNSGLAVLNCNGVPALLETGLVEHSGWEEAVQIFFERGWLKIQLPAPLFRDMPASVELYRGGQDSRVERAELSPSWAFRRQAEAFVADIRAGTRPNANAEDAQLDVILVEEIWRYASRLTTCERQGLATELNRATDRR